MAWERAWLKTDRKRNAKRHCTVRYLWCMWYLNGKVLPSNYLSATQVTMSMAMVVLWHCAAIYTFESCITCVWCMDPAVIMMIWKSLPYLLTGKDMNILCEFLKQNAMFSVYVTFAQCVWVRVWVRVCPRTWHILHIWFAWNIIHCRSVVTVPHNERDCFSVSSFSHIQKTISHMNYLCRLGASKNMPHIYFTSNCDNTEEMNSMRSIL